MGIGFHSRQVCRHCHPAAHCWRRLSAVYHRHASIDQADCIVAYPCWKATIRITCTDRTSGHLGKISTITAAVNMIANDILISGVFQRTGPDQIRQKDRNFNPQSQSIPTSQQGVFVP